MNINSVLAVLATLAILLALANISVTLMKVNDFDKLTGFAAGYVNITVNTQATINFSQDIVNWSSGTIIPPNKNASLSTNGAGSATIARGNWSASAHALVLANIGNVNVTLTLQSSKDAADFFGGSAGDRAYQWNISNKEGSSCTLAGAGNIVLDQWKDVNKSVAKACGNFSFDQDHNEIFIDIKMVVPYDAQYTDSLQTGTITATGSSS